MVKYMDRDSFFPMACSEINREDFLDLLKSDSIDVLKDKYDWVKKISDEENKRHEGLRNKAGLLLGFQIGYISFLSNGNFLNTFSEINKTKFGLEFTVSSIVIIYTLMFIAIFYSLTGGITPHLKNVVDPTLSLQYCKSEDEWLRETITEILIIYKKNLKKISLDASRFYLSFKYFIAAVIFSVLTIMIVETCNSITKGINFEHLIFGFCLGLLVILAIRYFVTNYLTDYEK